MKNWKTILIALAILALIVYSIYAWGKHSANGPQGDYPHKGNGIPDGWSPTPLANELHDAMNGIFTLADTKEKAWNKLYNLPTDDMVVAVYNVFGQLYFNEGNGTLVQWIRDEDNYVPEMLGGVRNDLLQRLQSLNLT